MRFLAVAVDYDGTLAKHGVVDRDTTMVLKRFIESGRKFILVTGRILKDLLAVFPEAALCSRIVAENGAVLYNPGTRDQRVLGAAPPQAFIDTLIRKDVKPLDVGESILATLRPHEVSVLEAIRDLGLEHHVVFNRESVMILPSGVNKASGLMAALKDLGLSAHNVAAIGDSENDHALLDAVECAVAVQNAIPTLKEQADIVTVGEAGAGVCEVLLGLVRDDLSSVERRKPLRTLAVGELDGGDAFGVPCVGHNLLLAGSPEDTRWFVAAMVERLASRQYQCCLIDSQGLQEIPHGMVAFGTPDKAPDVAEIMTALDSPDSQILVRLAGQPLEERIPVATALLERLRDRQERAGRPHRIVVTESEALFAGDQQAPVRPGNARAGFVYTAAFPGRIAEPVLRTMDLAIGIGTGADARLKCYAEQAGLSWPNWRGPELHRHEGLVWTPGQVPQRLHITLRPQDRSPSSLTD